MMSLQLDEQSYGQMYTHWNEVKNDNATFVDDQTGGRYINQDLVFGVLDEYGSPKTLQISDGSRIDLVGCHGDSVLFRFITDDKIVTAYRDGEVDIQ